jgi:predicted RNA-binding protein with RPS1 domain
MGLEEGRHFTVKIEGSGKGYVYILRKGLEHAAWLSVHASEDQRELAAGFVKYILKRAEEKGEKVYEKVLKVVEEGRARGSLRLEGFEKKVEVNGREHTVKVLGWSAELEENESGNLLLRIKITAEVDSVKSDYTITYGRYGKNKALGYTTAKADAPGGREADAERFSALIKALTGKEPKIRRMKDGSIIIECSRAHLDGFKRYAELADAVEKWLEETGR